MASKVVVTDTGISVLHEPKNADETSVDVCFVHGLQGHPRRTWAKRRSKDTKESSRNTDGTSKRASKKPSWLKHLTIPKTTSEPNQETDDDVFWPQDCLAADCPTARIMTWGYDSHVTKFFGGAVNQNTFYEHAQDLVSALERMRREARARPLIFVAHSLGGIIVKQAVFISKRNEVQKDMHDIYRSTAVIFFLGTPHRGSDYATWGSVAEKIVAAAFFDTNSALIDHLAINGIHLAELSKNFQALLADRNRTFDVYSYQEAKGYKGVRGLNGKIVDTFSSTIGDSRCERVESIDANHMDMCRFESKDDPGYKQVGADITYRVKKISEELQARLSEERNAILAKLDVVEMGGNHITAPYDDTAHWLIDDPRFQNWFENEHGLFWLKGKPGSGKSTLLKHTWLTMKMKKSILDFGPRVTASFFFNTRGTTKDRKLDNLLKALLFQLIEKDQDQYKKVLPNLRELFLKNPKTTALSQSEQRRMLLLCLTIIIKSTTHKRIVLFIDAIDESHDDDLDDIIVAIELLARTQNVESRTIDIVITSRPDTAVQFDMSLGRDLDLENENRKDIVLYVERELNRSRNAAYKTQKYHVLGQRVLEKANGVFLWVCLVVPRLRRCINRGDTLSQLLKVLEDIPSRLEELFRDIVSRINPECLSESLRMLQIVTLSSRPLSIEEFRHAFGFTPETHYHSLEDWEMSDNFIEPGPQILHLIQSRCGGLLEVKDTRGGTSKSQDWETIDLDQVVSSVSVMSIAGHDYGGLTLGKETLERLESSPERSSWAEKAERYVDKSKWPESYVFSENSKGEDSKPQRTDQSARIDWKSKLRVQLIHDTAKQFFIEGNGFQLIESIIDGYRSHYAASPQLYQSPCGSFSIGGHHHIAQICLCYMTMSSLHGVLPQFMLEKRRPGQRLLRHYPFFAYAIENWLIHATQAENGGMSQQHICQAIVDLYPKFTDPLIVLAAANDLRSWLSWWKDDQIVDFDTPKFAFGLPMRSAVQGGHIEAVKILLDGGAHANATTGGFNTSLRLAMERKNKEMVKLLYSYGATPSQHHWIPSEDAKVRVLTDDEIEDLSDVL